MEIDRDLIFESHILLPLVNISQGFGDVPVTSKVSNQVLDESRSLQNRGLFVNF